MPETNLISNGLVINLHFTDRCNYHCKFCYARFGVTPLSFNDWKTIISNILNETKVKRFNLAGGEPLAAPYLQSLIDYIHSRGVDCSIITNGSLLTDEFIRRNSGKLSMIGISIDGTTHEDDLKIGRADTHGRTLSKSRLIELAKQIHDAGIILKINTVVNSLNQDCDFTGLMADLQPERWKILRMICIKDVNDTQKDLLVDDQQFEAFVKRHSALSPVVEDSDDILHAYVVVNPYGQLVDNSSGSYQMSRTLLKHSFVEEFSKVGIDVAKYQKRYQPAA